MRMSLLCLAAWLAATLTAAPQAEIATRDVPVTFKTSVRLVSVPVVVRDRQGRAVGNLERDDFQLFAGGKTQIVSRFSVEKLTGAPGPAPSDSEAAVVTAARPAMTAMPDRFVAYVFDDLHLQPEHLAWVRNARTASSLRLAQSS